MGFLGIVRRKGLFGITWGVPGADTYEASIAWNRGAMPGSASLAEPFAQHAVIATAISILSADAASVGWEMYSEGNEDDPLEDHAVLDLFKHPGTMTGHQLWVGTYVSHKLFGEAFWYYPDLRLGTGRGGMSATAETRGEILLLDPRKVRFDAARDRWVLHVRGTDVPLDADALTQFKRFNPYNPLRGLSEIDAIIVDAEGDHAASDYNRRLMNQEGVPAGLLVPHKESTTPAEERETFLKRFNQQHARRGNLRVGAIPPGWTWQDVGIKPSDMEFKVLREYSREQILGIFGVPPFMAGVLEKANYANAREQREIYWLGTITRFLTEIASSLNDDFLFKLGVTDARLYPCWEKVKALTENLNEKVDIAAKLFAIGFPKRMLNERLDLGMDVDELEDADTGYLPFNLSPVSFLLDPPPMPTFEPVPSGDEEEEEPAEDDETRALRISEEIPDTEDKRRGLVWRNLVSRTRDLEARFNKAIRRHLHELEAEVLGNIEGLKGWVARNRTKAEGDLLFDMEQAISGLIKVTQPIHRESVKRGGESVLLEIDAGIDFNLRDPRVIGKLTELSGKITRIDSTVERLLRDSLADGVLDGESPQELAARVRQVMDASRSRSMTIARTETGFAFNTGRNEGMKQAGVKRHQWIATRDARTRDPHSAEDGNVVDIGEPFPVTKLLYPLDPSGPPGQIINCRCVAVPVLGEES